MKKISMFFAALILMLSQFSNSNAQPLQDFESLTFPPTGWTLEFTGTQYWTRQAYTSYVPILTGSAKFNFFSASGGTIQSLVTPTLIASVAGDSVKFDQSYRTYTGHEVDTLYIEASSNDGSTYTIVKTLLGSDTVGVGMTTRPPSSSSAAPTLASEWATRVYALPVGTNKIRFRAASGFGNNLYVDNIKTKATSTAIANDIAATSVDAPVLTISPGVVVPKATFSNVGTANQGSVPVKFIITGPVNFTGTTNISINSGAATQAVFSSPTFNPTAGSYSVKIIAELPTDGNRANDTLVSSFNVVESNFGSGIGGNFFANSISVGAPSKPEVCWPGYSGGTTLCVNGVNNESAIYTGSSLDDGYWRLGNILPSGYHIRLNGVNYDSIFIGTNGIIGLTDQNTNNSDFSPGALPDATQNTALYPLWKDFDLRTIAGDSYVKYMIRGTKLYVFYSARVYNAGVASPDNVFFGTFVELVNGATDSRVTYQYGDLSKGTTASFVSAVNNNTLADHVIGLQSGAGFYTTYRQKITNLSVFGPIFSSPIGGELAVEFGPNASSLNQKCASLTVTVSLQYCPSDSITVSLYDASNCNLIDTKKGYYSGVSSINFSMAGTDNISNFYLKVTQKNSMEIWSNQFSFTGFAASYNFTTSQFQELSGNLIFSGSAWSMISGDVNQDGAIDASDLSAIENDTEFGIPTIYPTDLNCDDFVDASDLAGCENNQGIFAGPPCAPAPSDNVRKNGTNDRQIFLPEVDKSANVKIDTNPDPSRY